jgi:hypothetical protein
MKTCILSIATWLLSTAILAGSASAQMMGGMGSPATGGGGHTTSPGTTMGGMTTGFVGGYGSYASGDYTGATTVDGSYLSGEAALATGLGKYNYDSARAAKQLEEARKLAIANQLLAQQAYYQLRAVNQAEWQAEHPRLTPEQRAQINQSRLPRRLSSADLDPAWGVIRWPAVLERPEFEKFREQFNDAFAHRADERYGVDSPFFDRVQKLAHDMRTVLDDHMNSMSQMQWIEAMRFIESLAYETRFPPYTAAGDHLAAR